ncbi:MAG: polysaccharide biosynthesis protein [Candidatus Latescibacterota bacterium]
MTRHHEVGDLRFHGDLCILDMGRPVRILEVAENMIRMAGEVPYEDIEVLFTGIRPGEELDEQLRQAADHCQREEIARLLKQLLPSYQPVAPSPAPVALGGA